MKFNPILFGALGALFYTQLPPSSARALHSQDVKHELPSVFREFDIRIPGRIPGFSSGGKPPSSSPGGAPRFGRPGGGGSSSGSSDGSGIGHPRGPGESSSSGGPKDGSGIGHPKSNPGSGPAGEGSSPGKYEIGNKEPPPNTPAAFTAKVVKADGTTKSESYFDQGRNLRQNWLQKTGPDTDSGAAQKLPSYHVKVGEPQKLGNAVPPQVANPQEPVAGRTTPLTTLDRKPMNFIERDIWGSRPDQDVKGRDPLSIAIFSKEQNAIGIAKSTSTYDKDFPLSGKERLRQSELLFQGWKAVAGDKVADLKYVMHLTVQNRETMSIVDAALNQWGVKNGRLGQTFTIDARDPDPNKIAAFNALSGSDNGRASLLIATDHKVELGGLGPVKVHVSKDDQSFYPDIIWELGRDLI